MCHTPDNKCYWKNLTAHFLLFIVCALAETHAPNANMLLRFISEQACDTAYSAL